MKTGHLAADQFKNWKKAEVEELAKDLGVSVDGTKNDIVARICCVEVEYEDDAELTPEEVKAVREAKNEAEAQEKAAEAEEETERAGGMVTVVATTRFYDMVENKSRAVGEEWEATQERADKLASLYYAKRK